MKFKHSPNLPGSVHAIVPVNVPRKSKARLSAVLDPKQRAELSLTMLADVLSALKGARRITSTTVVCADKGVRKVAERFSANFLWEGKRRGLNKSLRMGIRDSELRGAAAALAIHADLPLLSSRDVDALVKNARRYAIAMVPSKDGRGTNAMMLRPPHIMHPAFGKDSFSRHLSLVHQRGIRCRILRIRGISFDLDEPVDLYRLRRSQIRNRTIRFLSTIPCLFH